MTLHKFEATPTLNAGQVQWKLCYTVPTQPQCGTTKADYPGVVLQPNHPNEPFQFKIVNDQTGLDIKFADTNPLWVAANTQPTGPGVNTQIGTVGGAGQKTLTFVDLNSLPSATQPQAIVLKYRLNFTDGHGNAVTPIDPDIRNGGTNFTGGVGEGISGATAAFIAVAVIAILALAWLGIRSFRQRTR